MSLGDLASIGSFASGVAVIISLVYLSLQIRQNTKHSRALIQQGRAARIQDTTLRLAEGPAWIDKCFEGATDVSAQEIRQFLNVTRAMFIGAEDSYFQRRAGLVGDIGFKSFEASVKGTLGLPGLAAAWRLSREDYEPEFRGFMDRMLNEIDRSKPAADRREQWLAAVSEFVGSARPAS